MRQPVVSSEPMLAVGADLRIVGWNQAAARLTGIVAESAIGRPCWELLEGIRDCGGAVCAADCALAQSAFQRDPPPSHEMLIKAHGGRRRVLVATLIYEGDDDQPVCVHLLHAGRELDADQRALSDELDALTPRQRDVLALVADGVPAKVIAQRLGLAERTVRNYIRDILLTLRCHSQLEALAKLRRLRGSSWDVARDGAAAVSVASPVLAARLDAVR